MVMMAPAPGDLRGNQPVSWAILRIIAETSVSLHAGRRRNGGNLASTAWGAQNLISTQLATPQLPTERVEARAVV